MLVAAAGMLTLTVGCAHTAARPLSNRDMAELTARDVARVLRAAGFTDDEIIEVGPDVRNALARRGAVQVQKGRRVEAILAVEHPFLHISSRRAGAIVYDLQTHEFR